MDYKCGIFSDENKLIEVIDPLEKDVSNLVFQFLKTIYDDGWSCYNEHEYLEIYEDEQEVFWVNHEYSNPFSSQPTSFVEISRQDAEALIYDMNEKLTRFEDE
jgi:hypothetical protein